MPVVRPPWPTGRAGQGNLCRRAGKLRGRQRARRGECFVRQRHLRPALGGSGRRQQSGAGKLDRHRWVRVKRDSQSIQRRIDRRRHPEQPARRCHPRRTQFDIRQLYRGHFPERIPDTGGNLISRQLHWHGCERRGVLGQHLRRCLCAVRRSKQHHRGCHRERRKCYFRKWNLWLLHSRDQYQRQSHPRQLIGTGANGSNAVPNGFLGMIVFDGARTAVITLDGLALARATQCLNPGEGIRLGDDGTIGNVIRGNNIYSNGGIAINLLGGNEGPGGVTTNDLNDADAGPNNLQNYPVISPPRPWRREVGRQAPQQVPLFFSILISSSQQQVPIPPDLAAAILSLA